MSKEKLALDLAPYSKMSPPEAQSSLTDDIASLTLEASGEINPYMLIAREDGMVVNPERPSKDILFQYSQDTREEKEETKAAIKRRNYLLHLEGNYVVIWLSPPNPYPKSSLDVGIARDFDGLRALESYGISANFSEEECILLGRNVSSLTKDKTEINTPSDLRKTAFLIELDENDNPYDLLEEIIPIPRTWEKIRNGKAKERKKEVKKVSQALVDEKAGLIYKAQGRQLNEIGAFLEREMQQHYPNMDIEGSGCGRSNHEALSNNFIYIDATISGNGRVKITHSESGKFVRKCPYCGKSINSIILPGYKCSCGKEYKGVC